VTVTRGGEGSSWINAQGGTAGACYFVGAILVWRTVRRMLRDATTGHDG
jgi:hypothetical protein